MECANERLCKLPSTCTFFHASRTHEFQTSLPSLSWVRQTRRCLSILRRCANGFIVSLRRCGRGQFHSYFGYCCLAKERVCKFLCVCISLHASRAHEFQTPLPKPRLKIAAFLVYLLQPAIRTPTPLPAFSTLLSIRMST